MQRGYDMTYENEHVIFYFDISTCVGEIISRNKGIFISAIYYRVDLLLLREKLFLLS